MMKRGHQAHRTPRLLPRTLLSATALAACALLSACAVGPDYKRPDTEVPQQYKEAGDWKVANPSDAIARGKWWEIFNDPQLNALEEQVAAANQNIAVADAQYRQAQALVQSAQASFFPTLGASASATRSRSVRTTVNPDGSLSVGNPSLQNSQSLSLNASWELDLWGSIRRNVESNKASAQASAGDLSAALLSAQATLAQDYFQLRVTDTQKAVLQRTVADYARFLKLTENQYAVGVAQRSDVLTAQTQLKQAQALLLDTEVTRAQLEHAIAVLIGKPPAAFSLAPSKATNVYELPALPAIPLEIPSAVLERRPDVAAAERRIGPDLAAQIRDVSIRLYKEASDFAATRGIIIADTKFEFGLDENGTLTLMDEALTADSSRFWPADSYQVGTNPPSFDKQFVRDWLEAVRIDGKPWPKTAPAPELPADVIEKTADKYREALTRLTGQSLR